MNNNFSVNIIPAPEGMKYAVCGLPMPVIGYANHNGKALPIVDFPLSSDYEWQYNNLQDRLKHPEKYRAIGEDVDETIKHLKKWLSEHKK